MSITGHSLKQSVSQKQKFTIRTIVICSAIFFTLAAVLFVYFNIGSSQQAKATPIAPSFVFDNPSVYSGIAGNAGCIYKFTNVLNDVDAYITINSISNAASLGSIDIPQSTTGYENAFQPQVSFKAGTASVPQTSYIEWYIAFKKAGTLTDTVIASVSVTAIDVDGNNSVQESVSAPRPFSYSTQPGSLLNISQDATTLTAVAPTSDFGGIDSSNRTVMFQMNFTNIHDFVYRTVAINKAAAVSRQFSIYFKTFFAVSPLPVELIKFTGAIQDNSSINLVWTTASEVNNDCFLVERSNDGLHYKTIGITKGSGTTSQTQTYTYLDREMPAGTSYYRLTQRDFNGKTETFNPIVIETEKQVSDFKITNVYPNPFTNTVNVYYRIQSNASIKITLINSAGQQVKSISENATEGTNIASIANLNALPKGEYILTVSNGFKNAQTKKVVKN